MFFIFTFVSCLSTPHSAADNSAGQENRLTEKYFYNELFIEELKNDNVIENLANTAAKLNIEEKKSFCSFLNEHPQLFENILIEKISVPAPAQAGKPFEKQFEIAVFLKSGETKEPLKNTGFLIEYPESSGNGNRRLFAKTKSGENGVVSFSAPVQNSAIDSVLIMYADFLGAANSDFEGMVPETAGILKETLNDGIKKNISAEFEYKVATSKKAVTTTIAVLDFDQNNIPLHSENTTAVYLLRGLMQRKFLRTGLDEYRELAKTDDNITVTAARKKFNGLVERFIYGRTKILKIEKEENGTWSCSIEGTVCVWDFKTDRKTNEFKASYFSTGKTKNEAFFNARAKLGETILADKILYGL